ncbi:MAG: T9SS type A sorting domain-containing protein [Chthoniobacterales bacterium]
MKTISLIFLGLFFVVAATVDAQIHSVGVTISDASGRLAYQGATNANGTFGTGNLQPGNYVVQFRTESGAIRGNQYLLVIAAGKKKVIADSVRGEQFNRGGVTMKLEVKGGSRITGQLIEERSVLVADQPDTKIVNGHRYRYVTADVGTHLGPHWEDETLGPRLNAVKLDLNYWQKVRDHQGEGSLLNPVNGVEEGAY